MTSAPLPYAVRSLAGIGGTFRQRPEDFVVHEVPAYEPTGDGEHVLAEIEKTNLGTLDAIDVLARATNTPRRDIGYAGLKDKHAVTRQWVSLRGPGVDAVLAVQTPTLKVLFAERHRNKLRLGHLAGNRFDIHVRDVDPMKVVLLGPAMRQLETRGLPNYFGDQRFGRRGNNDRLGAAYARNDAAAVLSTLLGGQTTADDSATAAARAAYDAGDVAAALAAWPAGERTERAVLERLLHTGDPARAVAAVPIGVRRLWLSAWQSRVFNAVVARRVDALGTLLPGDVAFKHANGACFLVADPAAEQSRADAFEISPTGPMPGSRMMTPQAQAAAIEAAVLAEYGHSADTAQSPPLDSPGERRPLRVRPTDTHLSSGIDEHGPYVRFEFTLPPGAYATTLLREFMRTDEA